MNIFILLSLILLAVGIGLTVKNCYLRQEIRQQAHQVEEIRKELKALQMRLLESSKKSALATLSACILHQISQPITAITGFVRFMKKEMKPDDVFYKPVSVMDEHSSYLRAMLENLMELARHRQIQKGAVNVNTVLEKAMNLLSDELRIRRVKWDLHLDSSMPDVSADPVHLQQIFMNLSVNAIEALSEMPPGAQRTLEVSSQWDQTRERAVIRFKDNGPGINPQARTKVFDPFFSTKEQGSGMGLTLCRDLIEDHGGTIEMDGISGGTTFIISLPCLVKAGAARLPARQGR